MYADKSLELIQPWKVTMTDEQCKDCRFYFHAPNTELPHFMIGPECRRNPPTMVRGEMVGCWPRVYSTMWCGEFKRAASHVGARQDE